MHNVQLAEVEVLILNFQTKKYTLPEFVAEMANLKVLIVTNHGFLPAELSNFQVLGLLKNLKRIRLARENFDCFHSQEPSGVEECKEDIFIPV